MALSMPAILIFALSKSWAVVRLEEEIGKRACFSISRRVELVGIHLAIRWSRLQMITDQVTKMMPICIQTKRPKTPILTRLESQLHGHVLAGLERALRIVRVAVGDRDVVQFSEFRF